MYKIIEQNKMEAKNINEGENFKMYKKAQNSFTPMHANAMIVISKAI